MSCTTYYAGDTVIHRLDPRPRVLATLAFSLLMALTGDPAALFLGLLTGAVLVLVSRLPASAVAKRLVRLNIFMLLLFLLVPATYPGSPAFRVFSISYSTEGLVWSASIALKANAIVLVFAALLGTVEPTVLGHAFHHLRVPGKLTHLFMFTLRYLDVLHHEYLTLLRAMKARAFRPGMRIHVYRSYAYLIGMLLVRSLERSERVMAAMKCRGFRGEFLVIRHFGFHRRDLIFCIASILVMAGLTVTALAGHLTIR